MISRINKNNNKRFQYVVTIVLNHEKIEKHSGRIAKIL